ncbi:MAG: type IV pilus modification protein PilV [Xanthomonadales bacterium]|nr:type IV pilus modification protein PilV [Xanthomonadales bacterium]
MSHEKGFSLLEVLIAVLILAIGVIGIAALQMTTSMYQESSMYRGQVAMLSREIIERMQLNVDAAKGGAYNISTLPTGLTTNCKSATANCSTGDMVSHDLREWSARVADVLPGGDASIATDTSTDPVQITLTLKWDEARGQRLDDSDKVVLTEQAFVFQLYGLDS